MKKIIIIFDALLLMIFAFSSCKKSSAPPSIVGTWKLTNLTGTVMYHSEPSIYDSVFYSYNSANNTYTRIEKYYEPFNFDTTTYLINTEVWSFNADGTYSISESYIADQAPPATVTNSVTGTWQYLSNTHANDAVLLSGPTSSLLPRFQ